MLSRIQTEKAY